MLYQRLESEGALCSVHGRVSFAIPSPLLQTLLAEKVVTMDKDKPQVKLSPCYSDGYLNMPKIIFGALNEMNSSLHALHKSHMRGQIENVDCTEPSSLYGYTSALFATVKSLLPSYCKVVQSTAPRTHAGNESGPVPRYNIVIDLPSRR